MAKETISKATCDAKHEGVNKYLELLNDKIESVDRKVWALILLVGANVVRQIFEGISAFAGK